MKIPLLLTISLISYLSGDSQWYVKEGKEISYPEKIAIAEHNNPSKNDYSKNDGLPISSLGIEPMSDVHILGNVHDNSTLVRENTFTSNTDFDVTKYGATGNGNVDDAPAFQAAANAAIAAHGRLVIPSPSNFYKLATTIHLEPAPGQHAFWMNIEGDGQTNNMIKWTGPNDAAVFEAKGWKASTIHSVNIVIGANKNGVICWDLDTDTSRGSLSDLTFSNCHATFGSDSSVAWRLGHISGGGADISDIVWINCRVHGSGGIHQQIAWLIEGANTLNNQWFGGFGNHLSKMFSNKSKPGTGATTGEGNSSVFFYGLGASQNDTDFYFVNPGSYVIEGGRFESGKRFIATNVGSNNPVIKVSGVTIDDYHPGDGNLFFIDKPGILDLEACTIQGFSETYGKNMIKMGGFGSKGILSVMRCAIQASDPFYTAPLSLFKVHIQDNTILDKTSRVTTGFFNDSVNSSSDH